MILLLVEDNLPDALLVREAIRMEALPVDVHVVPDGERAIAFIERSERESDAPSPHVILLDLNLPRVEGFDVLRRIRASEKHKRTPVLVVTSSDSQSDRREAAKLADGYFRKPPDYVEFLKLGPFLRNFLQERGLIPRPA